MQCNAMQYNNLYLTSDVKWGICNGTYHGQESPQGVQL